MAQRILGRNAPCRCGSGKKYKKCHLDADRAALASNDMQSIPQAREYSDLLRSVLDPEQIRSDEVHPGRR
jgi:uncharacterized protein YecA (UPF0149 family)